ncbi:TatD family hydrolase [Nitratifractor salsuginis]|uniref:Hydrolase, TatD family n=1 Tax=Nitratifractor salsuginis (strain DSM 16511 / JCM 12458 / E9I37-1) TaxID=749222 RepID=E6X352_NITSE|nr:TatD family hydrolase [Nitratifractor salsuginis]ADV46196.1 hydrolase, TatD family [Nitratifractor salsuginis DSM 16511]
MIVDTHVHLDDPKYAEDLEGVLERSREAGVARWIIPAADPDTLPRAIELAERYEDIFFAVGVHPYDARRYERKELERHIGHEKCVAVGECGLDYYRLPEGEEAIAEEKRIQKEVFVDQIALAKEYAKPLIVHIREASLDSMKLLKENAGERGGVLHCYNADHQLLKLAERNFYYGIGGVLTFKNARKLVEVYPKIPRERLLIETDGPYLTPHPYRGKRNEPAYCRIIAEKMAELSGVSFEEITAICRENTKRLFGI